MKISSVVLTSILAFVLATLPLEVAFAQGEAYSYAYIKISGKELSKKLKVKVDFGDTPEQVKAGEEYSEILNNKKSYAAVLNYMGETQFELVETIYYSENLQGSSGNPGIAFIMKKKK